MASKLQEYRRMSEEAQRQLTGSLERWQSFLATASRLYKYPYHEQVMIHAQRPDATACAEFDVWNNTMRRYVRRGSKGIALIDTSGDRERLRYVFDVSDTGTRPNSRSLNLWELREEHIPAVSSMLEKNYGVPAGESLAAQLEDVASQLAREYWEDNRRDILGILEDSLLEEYDEFNVGVAFRNAPEVSISYELGFATFYLNRTNRSGIIKGGVIGGKEQTGKWTLDVRFNREAFPGAGIQADDPAYQAEEAVG